MKNGNKVVLAFSGGLDTSFCVVRLKEKGYRVITVFVSTGDQPTQVLAAVGRQARELGAWRHYTIDARRKVYDRIVTYLIKANGLYQDVYPQLCADRYAIVEECVQIAMREGTKLIAHGCTAMGNDQVRFDVSIRALGDYGIIAPIRELQAEIKTPLRAYEADYLKRAGYQVPPRQKKYTVNQNVLGVTISGSEIDELNEPDEEAFVLTRGSAQSEPRSIEIGFEKGLPVSLNGRRQAGPKILETLNRQVGAYGIGRFIYTGDCVIGIKGRIAFECPGLHALITAHRTLEESVLSREQNRFKRVIGDEWARLVFAGLYHDPLRTDLEKFIDSLQRFVTGKVVLKLEARHLMAVKYSSPYRIRGKGLVYAQQSTWPPSVAEGFVKLYGLSTTLSSRRRK
jgi:argininosuccinate synthase